MPKPPAEWTVEVLQERALRYLDRYDGSRRRVEEVLLRALRRAEVPVTDEVRQRVTVVLDGLEASGYVNDRRYAESLMRTQRSRGKSSRALVEKLRARGVGGAVVESILGAEEGDAELTAALQALRKKVRTLRVPLGEAQPKLTASLARGGFRWDVVQRAWARLLAERESSP